MWSGDWIRARRGARRATPEDVAPVRDARGTSGNPPTETPPLGRAIPPIVSELIALVRGRPSQEGAPQVIFIERIAEIKVTWHTVDDRVRLVAVAVLGQHRLDGECQLVGIVRDSSWEDVQRDPAVVVFADRVEAVARLASSPRQSQITIHAVNRVERLTKRLLVFARAQEHFSR